MRRAAGVCRQGVRTLPVVAPAPGPSQVPTQAKLSLRPYPGCSSSGETRTPHVHLTVGAAESDLTGSPIIAHLEKPPRRCWGNAQSGKVPVRLGRSVLLHKSDAAPRMFRGAAWLQHTGCTLAYQPPGFFLSFALGRAPFQCDSWPNETIPLSARSEHSRG